MILKIRKNILKINYLLKIILRPLFMWARRVVHNLHAFTKSQDVVKCLVWAG